MNDEQLRALLRLKRFERPPAGYYEDLLAGIRQRMDERNRSVFRVALDRIQTAFSAHSMGPFQFAGAMACLLMVGLAAIHAIFPVSTPAAGTLVAEAHGTGSVPPRGQMPQPGITAPTSLANQSSPSAGGTLADPAGQNPALLQQHKARTLPVRSTRYVIDPRPASYEPAFSF